MRLGMCGTGLFLPLTHQIDPTEAGRRLDWVCVKVIGARRQRVNRDAIWYEKARAAGVSITVFDALPDDSNWSQGLADAIAFAASVGASTYVIDAEPEKEEGAEIEPDGRTRMWLHAHEEAHRFIQTAKELCAKHGMHVGFTGWGPGTGGDDFPWHEFCAETDVSIPQTYDSSGGYDPSYMPRSVARYRANGAVRIVLGVGAYQKTPALRWRTPAELRRHIALVPSDICGMVFWPLGGTTLPPEVYTTLGTLSPPGRGNILRNFLRALTPFASQIDDC